MENELFKLENIRDIAEPINSVQGNLQSLKEVSEDLNTSYKESKLPDQSLEQEFEEIKLLIQDVKDKMLQISNQNINNFLHLKDELVSKYKETFKSKIKKYNLDSDKTKSIGLNLIEQKRINIIIDKVSYVSALGSPQWLDLTDSLKNNSLFLSAIKNISGYYKQLIEKKLENQLKKIPDHIDQVLVNEFKKIFRQDPSISFHKFYDDLKAQLKKKDVEEKSKIIKEIKKKEELQKLKEEQEKQLKSSKSSYKDYFKYSEKEFERRRRREKRKKLSDLLKKPSEEKELSEDVVDKIDKFKSKLDQSMRKKYIKEEEDKNPLDVIRERKEKKRKEYKKYRDRVKNN